MIRLGYQFTATCYDTLQGIKKLTCQLFVIALCQSHIILVCPMPCYAWTEYKFTCVYVCVSVTLSVNSPTGQTPQRIFTVDSLKDADLCKDVPFGGLDDE